MADGIFSVAFIVSLGSLSVDPTAQGFVRSSAGSPSSATGFIAGVPFAAVPEPATLALLGLGLAPDSASRGGAR